MIGKQKKTFLKNEGNQWFKRNKSFISDSTSDAILPFIKDKDKILEIGTSDGTKLNNILKNLPGYTLDLYGVDPSEKAINSGKDEYPNLKLSIGTSDQLEFNTTFLT